MNSKLKDDHLDILFRAMLELKTVDEFYQFFEDLCTVAEIKAMAQRFEVALMLDEQRIYTDIEQQTGASSATISRVNRSLNYGNDGYDMVFQRLEAEKGQE